MLRLKIVEPGPAVCGLLSKRPPLDCPCTMLCCATTWDNRGIATVSPMVVAAARLRNTRRRVFMVSSPIVMRSILR